MNQMEKRSYIIMPRLLSRPEAAHYVGVGTTLFDDLVQKNIMPKAKAMGERRVLWDRQELDKAIDELQEVGAPTRSQLSEDPYDDVHA
jgi:predicted DNA-binding transcriptional regulator AlpA